MKKIYLPTAPEHFDKACRVCLSEYSSLVSIAEISLTHNIKPNGKAENVSLISIFERFCDVKIKPEDKKPQKICEFCIEMTCKAFNHFQLFIYSDTLLNRKLRKQDLEQSNPNTKQSKSKDTPVVASSSTTSKRVTSEIDSFDDTSVQDDTEDLDCAEVYEDTTVAQDTVDFEDSVVLDGTVGLDDTIYFQDQESENEAKVTDNKEEISLTPSFEHIKIEVEEDLSSDLPIQKTRKRRRSPISAKSFHQLDTLQKEDPKLPKIKKSLGTRRLEDPNLPQIKKSLRTRGLEDPELPKIKKSLRTRGLEDPELPKIKKSLRTRGLEDQKLSKTKKSLGTRENNINDIFKCRFCKKTFRSMDKVLAHMDDEHESSTECILCPLTFRNRARIRYHVATHSPDSLVCKTCHLLFETKEEFDQHFEMLDHTNTKKCPKCEKTYRVPYLLRKHMEAFHLKKYKFQCRHCGKMFRYQANMSRHEHNTHGSKKFLCQVCAKNFSTNYTLKVHMQNVHKIQQGLIIKKYATKRKPKNKDNNRKPKIPRPPQYKCKFCDKEFDKPSLFYQHSQVHPEFDEYECLLCPHVLNTKKEYDAHYETHKTFKCRNETCPKMFTTNLGALAHSYTHNKRFKCDTCLRFFTSRECLRSHMNVHTGEKPYICEECGQGFKQAPHLKVHVAVQHQGHGKPWQCHLCDKAFSYNNTLKIHMRTHTGHKPFACLYCDKLYRDTTGRHKHIKKDHPEKMEEFLVYKENNQEHEKQQIREKFPDIE